MVESGFIEFIIILALAVAALLAMHVAYHLADSIHHSIMRMKTSRRVTP